MENLKLKTIGIEPVAKPFESVVDVPGSKSYSLRALFIAALTEAEINIKGLLEGDDSEAMQDCLKAVRNGKTELNARESGTTARFMAARCCISPGRQILTGAPGLKKRPIADLVDGLRELGAKIKYLEKEGCLPIEISSSSLSGTSVTLRGEISSQYISAMLLIAPALKEGLTINVSGRQISKPYIDMTIDIMSRFGVKVQNDNYEKYTVKPQKYQPTDYTVEADYSSASYFYAINYLTGSTITVKNLNPASMQADKRFTDLLGKGSLPHTINGEDFPDQVMTLAVLCAFSEGKYVINGVRSLRVKETERVRAVETELAKMGIKTESTEDTLVVYGGKPKPAVIDTYGDHRIAMAFAVAGTKIPGIEIANPSAVNKTFPGFWQELGKITAIKPIEKKFSSILLIGMRGSGKTTVGKTLAKRLNKEFIDMDEYLEEKSGKKIRDIVLEDGWDRFRELESQVCAEVSLKKNCIFSSGGGIVLDPANMKYFDDDCITLLLKAKPRILSMRIRTDKNRPELSTQPTLIGELGEVWRKRKERYFRYADFVFDTSSDRPNKVANNVMDKLGLHMPKRCLVIGDPIKHSLSPDIHNKGYKELGLDKDFTYEARRVKPEDIEKFIEEMKTGGIRGVSLTMPHKELVLPLLDSVDPIAEKIGAVNTIVQENGILRGYNTDWIGAVRPLEKITRLKGKKVAIIGAGGTAKAFAYGLTRAGCDVTIYNRTVEKAKQVAEKFDCKYASLQAAEEIGSSDIICNTTPVGMNRDKSPLASSVLKPSQIIYDVVYSPLRTQLIKDAEKAGAKTIPGIEMLLEQGFAQFSLFTGKEAPEEAIRKSILEKIK